MKRHVLNAFLLLSCLIYPLGTRWLKCTSSCGGMPTLYFMLPLESRIQPQMLTVCLGKPREWMRLTVREGFWLRREIKKKLFGTCLENITRQCVTAMATIKFEMISFYNTAFSVDVIVCGGSGDASLILPLLLLDEATQSRLHILFIAHYFFFVWCII